MPALPISSVSTLLGDKNYLPHSGMLSMKPPRWDWWTHTCTLRYHWAVRHKHTNHFEMKCFCTEEDFPHKSTSAEWRDNSNCGGKEVVSAWLLEAILQIAVKEKQLLNWVHEGLCKWNAICKFIMYCGNTVLHGCEEMTLKRIFLPLRSGSGELRCPAARCASRGWTQAPRPSSRAPLGQEFHLLCNSATPSRPQLWSGSLALVGSLEEADPKPLLCKWKIGARKAWR